MGKKEDTIKVICQNCKAEGETPRPFGMNKYLIKMFYSNCQNCLKEAKK